MHGETVKLIGVTKFYFVLEGVRTGGTPPLQTREGKVLAIMLIEM
jgi:hypothetical protein